MDFKNTTRCLQVKCACDILRMEQHTLKNVNKCRNTEFSFYFETPVGQSSKPYMNVVHFFNTSVY
jgi:hypothetical protein